LMSTLESLVAEQVEDPNTRKDLLNRALEDARSLAELIENVISAAEMDSRSMELDWGIVAVEDLISDILLAYEGLAQERQISLTWQSADPGMLVLADRARMRQAVGNVVENAIQYSDSGTEVSLEGKPKDGGIEIKVTDRGPGISKADQMVIFEKPYLRSGSPSGASLAAGMGLYHTRTIIEAHGGSIWLESERGRGSVFTIFIPHNS
jgi:signal transduction histidine kinase